MLEYSTRIWQKLGRGLKIKFSGLSYNKGMEGSETQPTAKPEGVITQVKQGVDLENLRDLQEDFRLNPTEELKVQIASVGGKLGFNDFDTKPLSPTGKYPEIYYHGTTASFDKFDLSVPSKDAGYYGKGVYVTPNPEVASDYSTVHGIYAEGSNVRPVRINLQNPLEVIIPTSTGRADMSKWGDYHKPEEITENLKAAGYDGVVAKNESGEIHEINIFDPNNIKSGLGAIKVAPEIAQKYQKIESLEFKKWFGDSKVVDSEGKPIVAYHGTTKNFASLNTKFNSPTSLVAGTFWSTDPKFASEQYAWSEGGSQVIPVWLSIKNPASSKDIGDVYTFLRGGDLFKNSTPVEVQSELIKRGFDGAKPTESTWVIFTPEQSKSIFNPGTFDATNPTLLDL